MPISAVFSQSSPETFVTQPTTADTLDPVGGLSVLHVAGTPRTMGTQLAHTLANRLHVLTQDTHEHLRTALGEAMPKVLNQVEHEIHRRDPSAHMELTSLAETAEISLDRIIGAHCFGALLAFSDKRTQQFESAMLNLPSGQTENNCPLTGFIWRIPAFLSPHVTLVSRTPNHGPATLTLTINGLHCSAGLSEARYAIVINELVNQAKRHHGLADAAAIMLALSSPSYADAVQVINGKPLLAPRAFTLSDYTQQRHTYESAEGKCHLLPDRDPQSARIHTNHALHVDLQDLPTASGSVKRLQYLARSIHGHTTQITPQEMASWLAERDRTLHDDNDEPLVTAGIIVFDPVNQCLHACAGNKPERFGTLAIHS